MVLFSSDVSARGVDYPDVTFILQVGLTERKQYIHRLGRTARAGKEGSGLLLLCNFEKFFLRELNDLPITEAIDDTPLVKALRRDSKTAPTLSPSSPMVRTLANVESNNLSSNSSNTFTCLCSNYDDIMHATFDVNR
jgi:superfamily II DNA/RNA helicase